MTPILTSRLRLRPFRPEDEPAVHAFTSDPEVTRYTSWEPHTPTETSVRLQMWIYQEWPGPSIQLAIESRDERTVIGWTGFLSIDSARQTGIFGYLLHRNYWGKGYATEAARGLIDWGFTQLNLHRVVAECAVENVPSTRILEKLGMRREAHFRKNIIKAGRWQDTYLYAQLREEWRKQ